MPLIPKVGSFFAKVKSQAERRGHWTLSAAGKDLVRPPTCATTLSFFELASLDRVLGRRCKLSALGFYELLCMVYETWFYGGS